MVCYRAFDNDYHHQITKSSTTTAVTANGAFLNILGQVTLPITIGKFKCTQTLIVADNVTVDCILVADCLRQHGAVIDCKECSVTMRGIKFALTGPTASITSDSVCTVTNAI